MICLPLQQSPSDNDSHGFASGGGLSGGAVQEGENVMSHLQNRATLPSVFKY